MPDLFILLLIIVLLIIAFAAIYVFIEGSGELFQLAGCLVCVVLALGLGKWWHWSLDDREWTTTAVYPIQNIDAPDGSHIQVFIVGSRIYSATLRWGKVFGDETLVRRIDCIPKRRGVSFWLTGGHKFEIVVPDEGSKDGT